jgi:hypothetical protein
MGAAARGPLPEDDLHLINPLKRVGNQPTNQIDHEPRQTTVV